MKGMWILLPALLLGTASAQARDIYCDTKGGSLPAGSECTEDWYVTNYKVRKPQLPGQTTASTSCGISFESIGGMYRPIEVLTRPKLGEIRTSYNRFSYRSAKNGEDLVSIKFHRLGRTGALESSVIHFRIHVVDHPL